MRAVDQLLRAEGRYAVDGPRVPWGSLVTCLVLAGFLYGVAMGSFAVRPLQATYSGIKVPLLLTVSSLICLPNFYAVNAVLGLREDFVRACRGILAAQAVLAVTLLSLAPVILFIYVTSRNYRLATLMNGVMFAIAAVAGQLALGKHYAPLIAKNPRHRIARRLWGVIYVFVAIQLAWMLRPFIGDPTLPSRFLRDEPWSNAYVVIARMILRFLGG